jgi:hypothetical protein
LLTLAATSPEYFALREITRQERLYAAWFAEDREINSLLQLEGTDRRG